MTRCYVSEQIAAYCDEPEQTECPRCGSSMIEEDGDLVCEDQFKEWCDYVQYAPGEDDF